MFCVETCFDTILADHVFKIKVDVGFHLWLEYEFTS